MKCRWCNHTVTRVVCTDHKDHGEVWRYIRCAKCDGKFKTVETYEHKKPGPKGPGALNAGKLGEKNHNAVMTEDDIREIRRLSANGMSGKDLSTTFGIAESSVSRIIRRLAWPHVA